ncbi:MAG: hypothetical protein M3M97_03140 [Actinomycetota bacterium]|nr:hypothetical protein [Actinomycetota bacterium]
MVATNLEQVSEISVALQIHPYFDRRRRVVFQPDLFAHTSPELVPPSHLDFASWPGQGELGPRTLRPRAPGNDSTAIDPEEEA